MADAYSIPEAGNITECHALGDAPEGYDGNDDLCQDCVDKFTCLPAAEDNPEVWVKRGARIWAVTDDIEVYGLLNRKMTYATALDRISQRDQLREAGELIPAELLVRKPAEAPSTPQEAAAEPEETEAPAPSPPPAEAASAPEKRKPVKKPAKKKTPARKSPVKKPPVKKAAPKKSPAKKAASVPEKRKPVKKAMPKKPPVKKEAPAKKPSLPPMARPKGSPLRHSDRNGKVIPRPRPITRDKMIARLGKVKLGHPIDLEIGMQIVRKGRDGIEHVVTLTDNGFLYNDELFGTLSGAAQNATGSPCRSGNDWFNLATSKCTEVRDARGKVIAKYGM